MSARDPGSLMGTPERPEVKTAFYSQISQAWQGPVKTSAYSRGDNILSPLALLLYSNACIAIV